MYLGRVIGRLVATQRCAGLEGEKLLLVQPLNEYREPSEPSLVACDVVDSGPGDLVHVCDGREATLALRQTFVPVDATIVGHVEQLDIDEGEAPPATARRKAARARWRPSPEDFGS